MFTRTYVCEYECQGESAKSCYKDKLALLGGITDPYLTMELQQESVDWQNWPEVVYPDILNNTPSPYTMQELKVISNLSMVGFLT